MNKVNTFFYETISLCREFLNFYAGLRIRAAALDRFAGLWYT